MNATTTKKLTLIITALLAIAAIMASCSKEPPANAYKEGKQDAPKAERQKAARGAKKGDKTAAEIKTDKAAKAALAANAGASFLEGGVSLEVVRNGQYVSLSWHIGTTGGKIDQVSIFRNTSGLGVRKKVAELNPDATSFKDCLPNDNAYWYWLVVASQNDKNQDYGPVKVEPDRAGSANYIDQEDKYKISVTRTDDLATLKWDFPAGEYKTIRAVRNKRPVAEPFKGHSDAVLSTLAIKSQYDNALPEANSEYWYWFQITLKSGAIIYKGPIKAEYAKTTKSSR